MKKQKRILFFSLTYHPFIGGAEVAVKEITRRIDPKDYAFDMITLRFDSNLPRFERVGNIDIFRVGFSVNDASIKDFKKFPLFLNKYLYPFIALFAAMILHKRKPYDAIATVMTSYASFAALFFKILFPKVPYMVRLDDGDPFEHYKRKAFIVGPLFGKLFTKADFAVTTSNYLCGMAKEMGYKRDVAIIPNGVNAKYFSSEYSSEELDALKKKIDKKESDIFIITTSRLVPKNGVRDIITALPFLSDNIKLLILGAGPLEESLKLQVASYKLQNRVMFGGQVGHQELPKYLKACDIFIRPSLSEGFGISFIEAMAAGLPVIATSVGGIPDFLKDGETGLFCNVRDPESIAEKVKLLLTNKDLRDKIISNAQKMVREKYDWDIIAKDMKTKVFDRLFETK